MMVRWWAAFFVCGMIFPPGIIDGSIVLAAAAAGFLAAIAGARGAPADRARVYCIVAAAGGIVLWQTAGVARLLHEPPGGPVRLAPPSIAGGGNGVALEAPLPRRPLDRVSLPLVKARLARMLDDGRLPERARSLVAALVLDERSGLRAQLRDAYSYLGITHFLALSGLHLGVIACALSRILSPVARGARRREAILLVVLAAYCSVVCFPPSLVRSYALIAAVTACRAAGLSSDLFGALAAGSFAVAAIDPAVPFDAGFQLSFAAVCGIAFIGMPLVRRADARLPGGMAGASIRAIAYPAIITCAVQFFTLPLTVSLFDRSSLVAPAANVVVSLPFTALLYAGIVYVFVPFAPVREVLAPPIALVCRFLDAAPAWLARRPHPAVLEGEGNWVLYGCGVIAVAHALGPACRRRAAFGAAGLIIIFCAFGVTRWCGARSDDRRPEERRGPAGGELAGNGYRYFSGGGGVLFVGSLFGEREARALVRALWKRGARAVDCCVVVPSRLRRGHGWHYLIRRMAVRRCLVSPYLAPIGGAFQASCVEARIECVVVSAGARSAAGPFVLEVLAPSYPPPPGEAVSKASARLLCRVVPGDGPGRREGAGIDPDGPRAGRGKR